MTDPPAVKTWVVDDAFKRELSKQLPSMNEPEIMNLWWDIMPDARRERASEETEAKLYVAGMLVTELRRRAYGQHSIERLHRCQVLSNDMRQVSDHLKFRAVQEDPNTRAASKGLWVPGMGDV